MRHVGLVFLISMAGLVASCGGGDDIGVVVGIGNPGGGAGMNTLAGDRGPRSRCGSRGGQQAVYDRHDLCARQHH